MSNLSDLLPSGGGGLTKEFVASGNLSNGQTLILNSDGTVTAVAGSGSGASVPAGSVSRFDVGATKFPSSHYDGSTGRLVVVFADQTNGYYGTACVGTVTGTSIVFSTLTVWNSASSRNVKFAVDPNTAGKMMIVFTQDLGTLSGVVGTYTGTGASASMSFGSAAVVLNYDMPGDLAITYDKNTAGRFVIMAHAPTNQGKGIVGNIASGSTTASMGSAVDWAGSQAAAPKPRGVDYIAYDKTADKFVTSFADNANSDYLNAIVGTISGTNSLSFGTRTASTIVTNALTSIAVDPLRSGSFLIAYVDQPNTYTGRALVATLSGTTVSFGTPVAFNSGSAGGAGNTNRPQAFMGSGIQDLGAITWSIGENPFTIKTRPFTISGTSVSFGTTFDLLADTDHNELFSAFNPAQSGQFTTSYVQLTGTNGGDVSIGQLSTLATNLTSTNFVGMPDAAYSSGATATVTLQGGVSLNQSSLVIGSTYYIQSNGSLATSEGTPSVEAGKAISATSLLLKGV